MCIRLMESILHRLCLFLVQRLLLFQQIIKFNACPILQAKRFERDVRIIHSSCPAPPLDSLGFNVDLHLFVCSWSCCRAWRHDSTMHALKSHKCMSSHGASLNTEVKGNCGKSTETVVVVLTPFAPMWRRILSINCTCNHVEMQWWRHVTCRHMNMQTCTSTQTETYIRGIHK